MGEDLLGGLSVGQQLAIIGVVGAVFVIAGSAMSSPVTPSYSPTVVAVGIVCLLYAGLRGGYEFAFGS